MPGLDSLISPLTDRVATLRAATSAGLIAVGDPRSAVRAVLALRSWGPSPAAGCVASALRYPGEPAVVDEQGTLTFKELDGQSNALAHSLSERGIGEGSGVAVMCRNHRGFLLATVAISKLGAHAIFLNTSFAGPQLVDVATREGTDAIVLDEEFLALADGLSEEVVLVRSGVERVPTGHSSVPTLAKLIKAGSLEQLDPPSETGRFVILTSGTTGTPKGARRGAPDGLTSAAALLEAIPFHARETTVIAAPQFHAWGFAHSLLALALSSTVVLRRKFDPAQTLADVERTRATALIVVPVMLQRIMELPTKTRRKYDLTSLKVIAVSGSALPGQLATRVLDEFGEVLYNLYGSTEVSWATIATPDDLRAAPGTAGKPPRGTVVKLLLEDDSEAPTGEIGRIFVGSELAFEGYTGGGSKDVVRGLMATGDVGRFDSEGRLFIEGRSDDMIVSGGENVFPREVEDLLAEHPEVAEVAVLGVPDNQFGQRLAAYVVLEPDGKASETELRGYVKANLARYKVPRDVTFIAELPRNPAGKVLKRQLS